MAKLLVYIIKRILLTIPLIFILIITTWIMAQLMPGDPSSAFPPGTPLEIIENYRQKWRLDDPWYIQLWNYLQNLAQGDLGTSAQVAEDWEIIDYLKVIIPRSIEIAIIPIIIIPFLGVKTGLITVKYRNKWQDTVVRFLAVIGVALPSFFLGYLLQYIFGIYLPEITDGAIDLPIQGFKTPGYPDPPRVTGFRLIDCIVANDMFLLMDSLEHLILPVACQTFLSFATITRQTRSSMLDVLDQDYIRTARAKGCSEKMVLQKHALRNALIPTATVIISGAAGLLAGTTIIEITFNIPALGNALISAINLNDYWLIVGIVQIMGVIIIFGNLFADIMYTIIDPRIVYD